MKIISRIQKLLSPYKLMYDNDGKYIYNVNGTTVNVLDREVYVSVSFKLTASPSDHVTVSSIQEPLITIYYSEDDGRHTVDKFIFKLKSLLNLII